MWDDNKESAAARPAEHWQTVLLRLHGDREVMHFGQRIRFDGVVHPPAFFAIADQSSVFQHTQVERQARLRRIELVLQLADAAFAIPEHVEDRKTGSVRERMKEIHGAIDVCGSAKGRSHTGNISTKFVTSTAGTSSRPRRRPHSLLCRRLEQLD